MSPNFVIRHLHDDHLIDGRNYEKFWKHVRPHNSDAVCEKYEVEMKYTWSIHEVYMRYPYLWLSLRICKSSPSLRFIHGVFHTCCCLCVFVEADLSLRFIAFSLHHWRLCSTEFTPFRPRSQNHVIDFNIFPKTVTLISTFLSKPWQQ